MGVEINIIIGKVIENVGLAMWQGPKLELVSHTNYSYTFLGLYKNVKVVLERLKMRHPIFVIKYGNHNLVLGNFFLNLVKFS